EKPPARGRRHNRQPHRPVASAHHCRMISRTNPEIRKSKSENQFKMSSESCCAGMKLNGTNVTFGINPSPSGWHIPSGAGYPGRPRSTGLPWAEKSQAFGLKKRARRIHSSRRRPARPQDPVHTLYNHGGADIRHADMVVRAVFQSPKV